jgi:hypothetical protein
MKRCDWCQRNPVPSRGARYCSRSCRQRAYENRVGLRVYMAAAIAEQRHVLANLESLQNRLFPRHSSPTHVQKETENAAFTTTTLAANSTGPSDAGERARQLHNARQQRYRQSHPIPCPATGQACVNGCRRRCAELTPEEQMEYERATNDLLRERGER